MATLSLFIVGQVCLSRTGREPLRLQPFGNRTFRLSDVLHRLYGHGSAIFNTGQQLGGINRTRLFATAMIAVAAAESGAGSDLFDGLFDGARIAFITSPHRNRPLCFQ